MLDLDDPLWTTLEGGYRVPFDPREALRALDRGERVGDAWDTLWDELHHQGDVGEATYAALPHLVRIHIKRSVPDWNTYAFAAVVEECRRQPQNPPVPDSMRQAYDDAWRQLSDRGLHELRDAEEPTLVCAILGVVAMAKGQFSLGVMAVSLDESERLELLEAQSLL